MARSSSTPVVAWFIVSAIVLLVGSTAAIPLGTARCGPHSNYAVCLDSMCCSEDGFCGYNKDYCMDRCHSQCSDDFRNSTIEGMTETEHSTTSSMDREHMGTNTMGRSISSRKMNPTGRSSSIPDNKMRSNSMTSMDMDTIMTSAEFSKMFPDRSSFYTYDALIQAMKSFPEFANSGDMRTRKREMAAFLAHIHHETDGLRMIEQTDSMSSAFCDSSDTRYPCVAGKSYHARGPLQITWNSNYGMAGNAMGANLLAEPEILSRDSAMSFRSAIWMWMTPEAASMTHSGISGSSRSIDNIHRDNFESNMIGSQSMNKMTSMPSCHEVMVGKWMPSQSEAAMGMTAHSFGVTTFMLDGKMECGAKADPSMQLHRAQIFSNFCSILGVEAGQKLECSTIGPV